jgi:hypothetical protein
MSGCESDGDASTCITVSDLEEVQPPPTTMGLRLNLSVNQNIYNRPNFTFALKR